jgi:beta-galactosidase
VKDAAIVRLSVVDSEGQFVPGATNEVSFLVKGPGRVTGCAAEPPRSLKYLRATEKIALLHGQAVAFIKAGRGEGEIEILAVGNGLEGACTTISVSSECVTNGMPIPALDERQVCVYAAHITLAYDSA